MEERELLYKKIEKIQELKERISSTQLTRLVRHCIEEHDKKNKKNMVLKIYEESESLEEFIDLLKKEKKSEKKKEIIIVDTEKEYYKKVIKRMFDIKEEISNNFDAFIENMKRIEDEESEYLKMNEVLEIYIKNRGIKEDLDVNKMYNFLNKWEYDIMKWDKYIENQWFNKIIDVYSKEGNDKEKIWIIEEMGKRYPAISKYRQIYDKLTREEKYELFKKIQKEGNIEEIIWGYRKQHKMKEIEEENEDKWKFCIIYDKSILPKECIEIVETNRLSINNEPISPHRIKNMKRFENIFHSKSYMTKEGQLYIYGKEKNKYNYLFHLYRDRIEIMTHEEYNIYKKKIINIENILPKIKIKNLPEWVYKRLEDIYIEFMDNCDIREEEEKKMTNKEGTIEDKIKECFDIICGLHNKSPYYKYHYCLKERRKEIKWNIEGKVPTEIIFPEYYLWTIEEQERYRKHKKDMEKCFLKIYIKKMNNENTGCLSRYLKEFKATRYRIGDLYINPDKPTEWYSWKEKNKTEMRYIKKRKNLEEEVMTPSIPEHLYSKE